MVLFLDLHPPATVAAAALLAANLYVVCVCTGTVLDAPAAAVYQLSRDGQVVGLAVSSEAAE